MMSIWQRFTFKARVRKIVSCLDIPNLFIFFFQMLWNIQVYHHHFTDTRPIHVLERDPWPVTWPNMSNQIGWGPQILSASWYILNLWRWLINSHSLLLVFSCLGLLNVYLNNCSRQLNVWRQHVGNMIWYTLSCSGSGVNTCSLH